MDEFVKAVNVSKSSLIRTDADELTYPIHILIRYEIEKEIFEKYVELNTTKKGIKLIRRYYGIIAKK